MSLSFIAHRAPTNSLSCRYISHIKASLSRFGQPLDWVYGPAFHLCLTALVESFFCFLLFEPLRGLHALFLLFISFWLSFSESPCRRRKVRPCSRLRYGPLISTGLSILPSSSTGFMVMSPCSTGLFFIDSPPVGGTPQAAADNVAAHSSPSSGGASDQFLTR